MKHQRLNFEDYFTICSDNYNGIKTNLKLPIFKEIDYKSSPKKKRSNRILQYCVRYDKERQCIQVIFQQTASLSDWKVNFNFKENIYDSFLWNGKIIQLKCHRGWKQMWLAGQDQIRKEIKFLLAKFPDSFIEIFGWSLGSGIAQLAAEDVYHYFKIKPYLYTFGSVKPFYGEESHLFLLQCCQECYNFMNNNDIVTKMPPFKGWFAINPIKVSFNKTCLFRFLNPWKYHTCYDKPELYQNIE